MAFGSRAADELREARAEVGVDSLLLLERRPGEVHERRRVDVDLEEAGRDRLLDERLDRADLLLGVLLHLLRVRLEVVALEEKRALPPLPDRRREHDGRVLGRALLGVAHLAAGDLEDDGARVELAEAARQAARAVSYDIMRTLIAGTVKPETSPRPRAS